MFQNLKVRLCFTRTNPCISVLCNLLLHCALRVDTKGFAGPCCSRLHHLAFHRVCQCLPVFASACLFKNSQFLKRQIMVHLNVEVRNSWKIKTCVPGTASLLVSCKKTVCTLISTCLTPCCDQAELALSIKSDRRFKQMDAFTRQKKARRGTMPEDPRMAVKNDAGNPNHACLPSLSITASWFKLYLYLSTFLVQTMKLDRFWTEVRFRTVKSWSPRIGQSKSHIVI